MTYRPPSGWIETLAANDGASLAMRERFHASAECPRIQQRDTLRQVDKPYSAPRCQVCATDDDASRRA